MQIPAKIIFNGREYESMEAMLPEVRAQYQSLMQLVGGDANNNGIPDVLEKGSLCGSKAMVQERIIFNGQEYQSVEQLPPDVRAQVARMHKASPLQGETIVDIKTSTALVEDAGEDQAPPPLKTQVFKVETHPARGEPKLQTTLPAYGWFLIGAAVLLAAGFCALWLSGIRPADLFSR
jgi:hypothetical protein